MHATIGPSIVIKGEVSGNEDLLIEGKIDGSVALDLHAVTVGGGGRVKANITGRVITIEGEVEGDLTAEEQIILRGSSTVHGDLKAPRVVLEDGATFRGLVDMGARRQGDDAQKRGSASASPGAGASSGAAGAGKGATSKSGGSGKESTASTSGPDPSKGAGGAPERRAGP
jgi:cytoskeletal protein CcmA (bactofilin family)